MIAKSKVVGAVVAMAFLVLSPVGVCAGMLSVHAPSHPCCPSPPSHHHGNGTGACICIDRQPAPPALPSPQSEHVTPVAATQAHALLSAFRNEAVSQDHGRDFTLEARFLAFHQLLV